MEEESVKSLHHAKNHSKRMDFCATQNVKKDTMELVQFAGKAVPMDLRILELTALNHHHMEEELDMLLGKKINVSKNMLILAVKNGVLCGTKNVEKDITMLHAVSVHQTAHLVSLI
jgi:hypothetical protein